MSEIKLIVRKVADLEFKLKSSEQYPQWRTAVEARLSYAELWNMITGEQSRPEPPAYSIKGTIPPTSAILAYMRRDQAQQTREPSSSSSRTTKGTSQRPASVETSAVINITLDDAEIRRAELLANRAELLQWESDNRFLVAWITAQIDSKLLSKTATSVASELWKELEQSYQQKGPMLYTRDFNILHNLKISDYSSSSDYTRQKLDAARQINSYSDSKLVSDQDHRGPGGDERQNYCTDSLIDTGLRASVEKLREMIEQLNSGYNQVYFARTLRSLLGPTLFHEPQTYEEALTCEDSQKWLDSMSEEYSALVENRTWDEVKRNSIPDSKRVIPGRWVFKRKSDGRYKSRWVVKGFYQQPGIDFDETYTSYLRQADFKTAFLNRNIDCEIYIELPRGYERPGYAAALRKSIYGLKQAPKIWRDLVSLVLVRLGLKASTIDPSVYIAQKLLVSLHVDDIQVAGESLLEIDHLLTQLEGKFKLTRLGEPTRFLAIAQAYKPAVERKAKHWDIALHKQREFIENGAILLEYIPTDQMLADALTKPLPRPTFERFVREIGMKTAQAANNTSSDTD
ncbi:hypothetical protein DV736_g4562, partial [Chaetothyriales sp. CBS 134916]